MKMKVEPTPLLKTIVIKVSGDDIDKQLNQLLEAPNLQEYGYKNYRCSAIKQISMVQAYLAYAIIEVRILKE